MYAVRLRMSSKSERDGVCFEMRHLEGIIKIMDGKGNIKDRKQWKKRVVYWYEGGWLTKSRNGLFKRAKCLLIKD